MPTLWFEDQCLYTFTPTDREWLIRALSGECGEKAGDQREWIAVSACMINRWAMLLKTTSWGRLLRTKTEAQKKGYNTFSEFLRAYSQPINPRWLHGGSKDKDPTKVDAHEERRLRIQTQPLQSFSASLHKTADQVLALGVEVPLFSNGMPEDLVGIVHFYSPVYYYAKKVGKRPRDLTLAEITEACRRASGGADGIIWSQPKGTNPRSNAFYKIKATKGWKPETVRVG